MTRIQLTGILFFSWLLFCGAWVITRVWPGERDKLAAWFSFSVVGAVLAWIVIHW